MLNFIQRKSPTLKHNLKKNKFQTYKKPNSKFVFHFPFHSLAPSLSLSPFLAPSLSPSLTSSSTQSLDRNVRAIFRNSIERIIDT